MSQTRTSYVYRTPHGPLSVSAKGKAITAVVLGDIRRSAADEVDAQKAGRHAQRIVWEPTETTNRAATELLEYFSGKRRAFDLDLAPDGTEFQKAAWKAVAKIPYGQTRTPRDIACAIGRPSSYRMVGAAVKACPIAILIPTHRIVGANGRPLGVDADARLKTACLKLEQTQKQSL